MIVEQSNLYAMEVMSDEKYEKWDPISIEDMEVYLDLTFYGYKLTSIS